MTFLNETDYTLCDILQMAETMSEGSIVTEIRPFWRVYFYVLACVRLRKSVLPHSHYTIRIAFRDWNSKTTPLTFRKTILRLLIRD